MKKENQLTDKQFQLLSNTIARLGIHDWTLIYSKKEKPVTTEDDIEIVSHSNSIFRFISNRMFLKYKPENLISLDSDAP